jgi:precorrin-2/cobalt-factor-2 C20-methyltransferase
MTDGAQHGCFHGVGLGPGDPELITRRGERALRAADRVMVPARSDGSLGFAGRILEGLGLVDERLEPVSMCMGRDRTSAEEAYARAADRVVERVGAGERVAWAVEGDPLFYATFVHLYRAVRERAGAAPVEIVPGVTSLAAATAATGMRFGALDEAVAVMPAMYGLEQLEAMLARFDTLCLLKAGAVAETLPQRLPADARAVLVEEVGTPRERITEDLSALASEKLSYFALVLIQRSRPS